MKNRTKFIDRTIKQARKKWGVDEQWVIAWEFSPNSSPGRDGESAGIEFEPVGEKHALISLDPSYETSDDLTRIRRDIYHEIGHLVIYPVERNGRDWATKLVRSKKMRAVFDENMNSAENLVIDHIVVQSFKI